MKMEVQDVDAFQDWVQSDMTIDQTKDKSPNAGDEPI